MSRLTTVQMASASSAFYPKIHHTPALPAVSYASVGQEAPAILPTPPNSLPKADAIVITWAGAEWAAMQHVFCAGSSHMPYSQRDASDWPGWEKYDSDIPSGGPSDWTFWGYTRLVQISGKTLLLFKSNTHLDWPGSRYLQQLIQRIIASSQPDLILSIGTAGGAVPADHIGTVRSVSAGTLYAEGQPPSKWPGFSNSWKADWSLIGKAQFANLLFPIPSTQEDLESIRVQYNQHYATNYALAQLNAGDLDLGDATPKLYNQTGGAEALLTTSSFVVATTAGNFKQFACVEMDDAIIGEICQSAHTPFGFIRNISDPVQNSQLPPDVQGNWGSAIYNAYGFYTSYNGALAAWAILTAQYSGKQAIPAAVLTRDVSN